MTHPPRILLAGGGTGGHVYPAIAIADAVRGMVPDSAVAFAGSRERLEWDAIPRAGYPIYPIAAAGLQRRFTGKNLKVPFTAVRGLMQSLSLVGDFDADVVVGTGGFVSGPVGLAAFLRRRPLLIQEQNALAGATNRLLGRLADRIHIAFSEAASAFPSDRAVLTGNPVRPSLSTADPVEARKHFNLPQDAAILFVAGGSMGSQAINEAVAAQISDLVEDGRVGVIWQTGHRYLERLQAQVPEHPRVRMVAYIERMDLAYAAADLVMSRSGAITCSELLAAGRPAVLVPSPNVAEDHQTRNAESLVRMGAAQLLPESELRSNWLSAAQRLLADPEARRRMTESAREHRTLRASDRIASDVLALADRHRGVA